MRDQIEIISKEEWMASKGRIKKNKKPRKGILYYLTITFIGFIFFVMFCGWKVENAKTAQQKAQEEQRLEAQAKRDNIQTNAVTYSKITVQKLLKSPSTTNFPSSAFQAEDYKKILVQDGSDNQIWYIQSYVDSQNSLGATVRTYWAVKIQMYEDETYKILDVDMK